MGVNPVEVRVLSAALAFSIRTKLFSGQSSASGFFLISPLGTAPTDGMNRTFLSPGDSSQQQFDGFGLLEQFGVSGSELLFGALLEPLGSVFAFRGEQFLQLDLRRGTVRFDRLDGDRIPAGDFQVEPHHRTADHLPK